MFSTRRRMVLTIIAVILVGGFVILQLVPGYARTNPPITFHINWNSSETEALMRTTCYDDCHSNETVWPWYSTIAPVSWLVVRDVNEGREAMNFSQGTGEIEAEELVEQLESGTMPPRSYLFLHPESNLSAAQKSQLINGIEATSLAGGDD